MPNNNTNIKATINIGADIGEFQSKIKVIQGDLNKLNLSSGIKDEFQTIFKNLENEIKNIQNKTAGNELFAVDEKEVAKSFGRIGQLWNQLTNKISSSRVTNKWLEKDVKAFDELNNLANQYIKSIKGADSQVGKLSSDLKKQEAAQARITSSLEAYEKIQKELSGKETGSEAISNLEQKLAEQKKIVAEKEKELKAAKELKRFETADEYKERFKADPKHGGSARGWNSAYIKEQKAGTLKEVEDIKKVTEAENEHKKALAEKYALQQQLKTVKSDTDNLANANKQIDKLSKQAAEASDSIKLLKSNLETAKADAFKKVADQLQKITTIDWASYGIDPSTIKSYDDLEKAIEQIKTVGGTGAEETLKTINDTLSDAKVANDQATKGFQEAGKALDQITEKQKSIDQLRSRIIQFFSIGNAVQLFRRAIRSAINTVQDLDKVMTETAVVTEFSVGDMWTQLPEYTKRANELGVSIHDVYEASTLYYQQGLKTNEVMAVTNATLRMARIAGLEAAEATDRVTNALRGFNMEINEANADNIADVYSKLAAISASNVDEISTAMTKVASLANSANMSFENTAAFLSQIIETTRESAETAGTALKTVVARFSEVKDLYSKGELLGTDEEGEEVDVNKVSKALRTAGINLNEFLVGNKGLDQIFMELASRWDDLDIVQQRYIATMAAGSRQQSRFIALMSDYKRTQELTTAAQNANGASLEQYNKTLESLETKLTRLKNAWNEFLMSIANSDLIKGAVDILTNLIQTLNKVTDTISGGNGLIKSISAIGLAWGGLKIGRNFFNGIFGNPKQQVKGVLSSFITGADSSYTRKSLFGLGNNWGSNIIKGTNSKLSTARFNLVDIFKKSFGRTLTASDLGLEKIDLSSVGFTKVGNSEELINSIFDNNADNMSNKVFDNYANLSESFKQGTINAKEFISESQKLGLSTELTSQQAEKSEIAFKNQAQSMNLTRMACVGLGAALLALSNHLKKTQGETSLGAKVIQNLGVTLMSLGTILPMVGAAFQKFGVDVSATIMGIPIIGWIAAAITAIIAFVTVLTEVIETPQEAAENAKKALEAATEAANKAAEAVDNLASSYDDVVAKASKLEELTKGTQEWKQAVEENNKAVLDLLQNYKELNVISKDGVLTITNYETVMEDYSERSRQSRIGVMGASVASLQADLNNNITTARNALQNSSGELTDSDMKQLAILAANSTQEVFEDAFLTLQGERGSDADLRMVDFANAYNVFRTLGESVNSTNNSLNSYRVSLGQAAVEQANLTDEQSKYTESLINNTKSFDDAVTNAPNKYKNLGEIQQGQYREYIHKTYGNDVMIDNRGRVDTNGDGTKNVTWDTEKNKFMAWLAVNNNYITVLQKETAYLTKLSNSTDKYNQTLAKSYEGLNGELLTQDDIDTIETEFSNILGKAFSFENFDLTQLQDESSEFYQNLLTYYNSNDELKEAFGGDAGFNAWAETFATNILTAQTKISKAYDKFNSEVFTAITKNFGSETIATITQQLSTYKSDDIGALGATIVKWFSNHVADQEFEKVLQSFSTVALNSTEDLKSFRDVLNNMGIDIAESEYNEFIKNITDGITQLTNIDVAQTKEQLEDFAKVISDIRSGKQDRTFSKDIYDKMVEAGVNNNLLSEFTKLEDGSYLYIGDKLDDVVEAINQQTSDLLGKGRTQLEAKEFANEATRATHLMRGDKTQEEYNKNYLQQLINYYDRHGKNIGDLGINGLYSNDIDLSVVSDELIASYISQFNEIAANKSHWQDELSKLQETEGVTTLMQYTLDELVSQFSDTATSEDYEKYRSAILSKFASIEAIPDQIIEDYISQPMTESRANELNNLNYTYNQAQAAGLDLDQVKEYADLLMQTKQLGIDSATSLAVKNIKLNQSVSELISSYEDWNDLIGENGPLGKGMDKLVIRDSDQAKAYDTLKKKMGAALDVEKDLSDEFFASTENIKNLETLMNGTEDAKVEALHNLQKAAAIDFINPAMEQYDELVNLINGLEIPDMEVGATLEDGPFLDSLKEMCALAGDASDTLMDYLGFETEDYIKDYKTITYYTQRGNEPPEPYDVKIPIWGTRVKRKGGGTNWSTLNSGNRNNTGSKDSGSKSGSGSGSSSKPKLWKNPYDELYNLQQHINDALREREQLEHKYQDMLKDHTKTSEDLVENTLREVAALQRRLALEKQMLAGRKRQVANVLGEMFEDSEGNRTTLGAMGVGKYANYDVDAGVIQIDYDAIDQIVDENLGSAIEQYISRLEELQDQINDTEDAIEEISDDLVEIKNRGKEEYLNFEQKVYDAIVHAREKEIETLEAINDAISDAASKTISAIQDEISKERQARENDKAEEDILDKEMRLAYLQRDTSGANDLEIKKLQEEITNDQQSYQDKIIDQTIQEMQDEATRAEQQRQAQIDILNEQLEWDQNYGKLWEDVQDYLKGAFDDDGRIKVDSGLYQLLSSDDGLIGKSEFGALQWKEDLAEQVAIAMQGLQNYTLTAARNEGQLKLADGTELSYNPKSGGWYNDKTKKEYTDSDLEWDYDAQAYKIRQKPIANMPTNDTGVGLAQPTKATDATPTEPIDEGVIGKITNTYGWVNVRSSVDTSSYSNVIGHTNTGEQLDVIGYGDYGWYKVKLPNGQIGYTARHQNGTQLYSFNAYAHGGLADFTGPAWLDGSKSRPEMLLDAADTQNFIALKDILASILRNTQSGNTKASSGDNYFDIDIQAEIDSDYDVDRLAERIKKQIYDAAAYRNVNVISQMR